MLQNFKLSFLLIFPHFMIDIGRMAYAIIPRK